MLTDGYFFKAQTSLKNLRSAFSPRISSYHAPPWKANFFTQKGCRRDEWSFYGITVALYFPAFNGHFLRNLNHWEKYIFLAKKTSGLPWKGQMLICVAWRNGPVSAKLCMNSLEEGVISVFMKIFAWRERNELFRLSRINAQLSHRTRRVLKIIAVALLVIAALFFSIMALNYAPLSQLK